MPILKQGNKWKIGKGKPIYKSKSSAEKAYKGYLFHKYGEAVDAKKISSLITEAYGHLSPMEQVHQAKSAMEFIDKHSSDIDRKDALHTWLESKDFAKGDVDSIGDQYKEQLKHKSRKYPDWDEAVHFTFNEDRGANPNDQDVEGWFGESLAKSVKHLESVNESDPDIEKAKEQVKQVHDQLSKLKVTIHKEREAGKSQNVLDSLKKQWQQLQDKIFQIWKSYDQKHGTKYSAAYA